MTVTWLSLDCCILRQIGLLKAALEESGGEPTPQQEEKLEREASLRAQLLALGERPAAAVAEGKARRVRTVTGPVLRWTEAEDKHLQQLISASADGWLGKGSARW